MIQKMVIAEIRKVEVDYFINGGSSGSDKAATEFGPWIAEAP